MDSPKRPELLWSKGDGPSMAVLGNKSIGQTLSETVDFLAACGVQVHPSSRIAQYRRIIDDLSEKGFDSKMEAATLVQSFQEAVQLGVILRHFSSADALFKEKAHLLLQDRARPDEANSASTPGRDTQFELFTLACLRAGGIEARLAAPPLPDIVITSGEKEFGLEAKRLKSEDKLSARVKHAGKQLKKVASGGIVATDLTLCIWRNSRIPKVVESPIADLESKLYDYMFRRHGEVSRASKQKTFAWLGFAQLPYIHARGHIEIVFQWKCFNLCHETDPHWLLFSDLMTRLAACIDEVRSPPVHLLQ